VQGLFNLFLFALGWSYHKHSMQKYPYSPMQDEVQYEVKRWVPSLGGNSTAFMGQSDEVDARWDAISNYGMHQIPKHIANLLAEETTPVPGHPDSYVIGFEIFHQLHCLDMLRRWFHPEHYPRSELAHAFEDGHIDHCVKWLQQTTMCVADVNPIPWQRNEAKGTIEPKLDALHECRSWDDVWRWSKGHRVTAHFDDKVDPHAHHHH